MSLEASDMPSLIAGCDTRSAANCHKSQLPEAVAKRLPVDLIRQRLGLAEELSVDASCHLIRASMTISVYCDRRR